MTEVSEWVGRVGRAWAEEWRRTDRSFGTLTDTLIDVGNYAFALDIGCGAGEVVERLARANPTARITGIDISSDLVGVGRARCAGLANASLAVADASTWQSQRDEQPDLLLSRHGVMFFTDPIGAFAHLRNQAALNATLRFSCFRAREDNGWAIALASAIPRQPATDPHAPGPFAFAEPAYVKSVLTTAGWCHVDFRSIDYAMVAGEGPGAVDQASAYFQRIGPVARVLAGLMGTDRASAMARLRGVIDDHHVGVRVALPAAAWIVTARAPAGASPLVTARRLT